MMLRTALLLVMCHAATSTAGPKAKTATLAVASTSITGTGDALVKKMKRASAKPVVFHECEGQWTVHYAVALAAPVPSAELTLEIIDVAAGREPVATRHKFVYTDAAVVRGMFKLDRSEVRSPSSKLMLEIESEGVALARQAFFIQGTGAASSGRVEFTAQEAAFDDEVSVEDVQNIRH